MKSAVELNILLLKFVLLCLVDIQESFREDNAKFNVLGIIWESKGPPECIFQAFKEHKIQNLGNRGVTSRMCWVYHKSPALSYSEVGIYEIFGQVQVIS